MRCGRSCIRRSPSPIPRRTAEIRLEFDRLKKDFDEAETKEEVLRTNNREILNTKKTDIQKTYDIYRSKKTEDKERIAVLKQHIKRLKRQ